MPSSHLLLAAAQAGGGAVNAVDADKPQTELEKLREENERLKATQGAGNNGGNGGNWEQRYRPKGKAGKGGKGKGQPTLHAHLGAPFSLR